MELVHRAECVVINLLVTVRGFT